MVLPPNPEKRPGPFARLVARLGEYVHGLAEAAPPSSTLPSPLPFLFGGVPLSAEDAFNNLLILGSRGSGKTILLRLLLQSIACEMERRPWKMALYDGKNELYSILCALTDPARIVLVNPFDARSAAWRIHRDITTLEAAFEFATILVPEDKRSSQPFFDRAASRIFYGVIVSHMEMLRTRTISGFSFHDLIFAAQDTRLLRLTLAQSAIGERIARKYFDVRERLSDVIATLDTKLAPFEPIAESSAEATTHFSLSEWQRGGVPILLLGTDESNPYALRAFNRALFARIAELTLAQPNIAPEHSNPPRTFIVIEEASKAGELPGLDALSVKDRSKAVTLAILSQSLGGLEAVYGKEILQEIIGQFGNRALLRTEEPYTAQFCSQIIGQERKIQYSHNQGVSYSSSGSSTSYGLSWHVGVDSPVLYTEFMTLPPTNAANGLSGFYLTPGYEAYRTTLPPHILFDPRFLIPPADVADFLPRDRAYDRQAPPDAPPPAAPTRPALPPAPSAPSNAAAEADDDTSNENEEPPLEERRRNIRDFRVGL